MGSAPILATIGSAVDPTCRRPQNCLQADPTAPTLKAVEGLPKWLRACVTHWLAWRRCNWGGLNYEWWLDPNTKGPGTHAHPEDHVFYIIEGTVSIAIDGEWFDAARGSYASIPGGGLPHDPGAR